MVLSNFEVPIEKKKDYTYLALLNYFKMRYRFSLAITEQLVQDVIRVIKILSSDYVREGQILRFVVSNSEPPGKALKDCRFVLVKLTIYAPGDKEYRKSRGLKELKLRVMQRITGEAFDQGGSLSQEDIADILFLDRRTVVDYIRELESRGIEIFTRAKLNRIKNQPLPKTKVIKMFLKGAHEEEIASKTYHDTAFIKKWVEEFLQTSLFYHRGISPRFIPKITGIDPESIREYLQIYDSLVKGEKELLQSLRNFFSFYEKASLSGIFKEHIF